MPLLRRVIPNDDFNAFEPVKPCDENSNALVGDSWPIYERGPWNRRSYRRFVVNEDYHTAVVNIPCEEAWALERLIEAGEDGCTPVSHPAPNWHGLVQRLRAKDIAIGCVPEPNDGTYPGFLVRYFLRASVREIPPATADRLR